MSKVYLPGKDGQVMQIDYATMARLRKKKEEQKQRELEEKRLRELEEQKLRDLENQKLKEQMEKEKEKMEFHKKRKTFIKYGFAKKILEIGLNKLQLEEEEKQKEESQESSLTSISEQQQEEETIIYERLQDIELKHNWVQEKPKKISLKAQNITTDQKMQEIMQILKLSKLEFQQQMGEDFDIFQAQSLQKTSLNNTLNTSILSHQKPFRPQVPVGKLFRKEPLLVHKDDTEIKNELQTVKMEKSMGLKAKSLSPERHNNQKKDQWKPGKYYPSLFRQEPLLVHKTFYEKVYPHQKFKNYLPQLEKPNQIQNLGNIKEEDDVNFKYLSETEKKIVKERLKRYDLEKKQFPIIQNEQNHKDEQLMQREKMWRPQNTVNKPFEKQQKLLTIRPDKKNTENSFFNKKNNKNNESSQFLDNSISTNAQNYSTQSVKKISYPRVVEEKQHKFSIQKDIKQRSLSPKRFSNNKQIVYKPQFKDLHNYNSQNKFDKQIFNNFD